MVIRNEGGELLAHRPLDLGALVVQAAIVAVDDERQPLLRDPQLAVHESKPGPRMPESDHIGRCHEQDVIGTLQRRSMGRRLPRQQLGPDVENHVAEPTAKLVNQALEETWSNTRAKLQLWSPAQRDTVRALTTEWLTLSFDGIRPLVNGLRLSMGQHVQVPSRIGVDMRGQTRPRQIGVDQHRRCDQAQSRRQVQRNGRSSWTARPTCDRHDGQRSQRCFEWWRHRLDRAGRRCL